MVSFILLCTFQSLVLYIAETIYVYIQFRFIDLIYSSAGMMDLLATYVLYFLFFSVIQFCASITLS